MFKVNIECLTKDISWSKELPTEQEAQAFLNSQIGKPHRLPQRDKLVSECSQEELDSALSISNEVLDENNEVIQPAMATLPATFTYSIVDITAQKAQEETNRNARKFLADTDYKITRHSEDLLAGRTPAMSQQELEDLMTQRQAARNSIVD
jgi:hypothetical protein